MGSKTQASKKATSSFTNEECISKLKNKTKDLRVTGLDVEANPTLEIALLMDCTGSMQSWINKAKETLNEIIDKVVEECKEEGNLKVRVSFVGYRDIKEKERFRVMPFTEDINAIKEFINNTNADGGADAPEDVQGGLKLALLQDWTEEASKRVFLICDAPCHGSQYHSHSDDFPKGSPEGLVLEDMMKEYCKKEIEFTVLKLDHSCNKMIETMKSCHQELEVTDMTGISQQAYLVEADSREGRSKKSKRSRMSKAPLMTMSLGMAAPSMKMDMAMAMPEKMMMMEEEDEEKECMDSIDAMPMRVSEMSYEDKSRDLFRSEATQQLTAQVFRKQAAARSKKAMD